MPVVTDPAFLVLYGLDESGLTSTRANSGSLGSAQDLSAYQSSGSDGIVPVDDERGGKAAWFDVLYPAPYDSMTSGFRSLRGAVATGSSHACKAAYPISSANDDFAFGCRFKWISGETDGAGATEAQHIFGLSSTSNGLFGWAIGILPNTNANPATGAKIQLRYPAGGLNVGGASWTETGSPTTNYIAPDVWYRVVVRVYFSSSGYLYKVYVYEESTGTTYTFTYNSTPFTDNYSGSFNSESTVRIQVGYDLGGGSNPVPLYGYIDECWLFDSPLSDGDATTIVSGGFQVPWVEPDYRVDDHDVEVTYANEGNSFPTPRQLPVGGLVSRHMASVGCERFRLKYQSCRAGRPFSIRRLDVIFDTNGPWSSRRSITKKYDDLTVGLVRLPGSLPTGALVDCRNVEFSGRSARTRRGFRIRRNVDSSLEYAHNAFYSFRDSSNVLYRMYKAGTKCYAETGSAASQIDTGWSQVETLIAAVLDNRLIMVSASRRKSWRGSNTAVESFGVATPAAPTAATAAGTLTGTYYYAYTEYDPTTGDESGPAILVTPISPAAQGVTLTLAAVSSDTRFSKRRIYRTTNGGAAPDLYLIATINTATSYTDSGATDGTAPVGRILDSDDNLIEYFTGTAPQSFQGCCEHAQRMLYWYRNTIYWTPENEPFRWATADSVTTNGSIKAIISIGSRFVAFTSSTVEIFETTFERDGTGIVQIRRHVASEEVGCVSPHSPVVMDDDVYWLDRRGIYKLLGDRVIKISDKIDNLFRYLNVGYASVVSGAVNHFRNQIWWACPFASLQDDNTRFQTVIVMQPGQDPRWALHEIEASYINQFDDDLNGIRFGLIDHLGVFKELESYEGDGAEGDESPVTEDSDGISSISGSTITVTPNPGWTTNEHRGKGVVLKDVDTNTLYYYTISSNTGSTFTVVGTPNANLEVGDGYYIGGFRKYFEIAEQDLDSPNFKTVRQLQTQFDDLTQGRFV